MTKREKQELRECIDELMADDGDFCTTIVRLGRLCGVRYPLGEALLNGDIKATSIADLPKVDRLFSMNTEEYDEGKD